MKFLVNGSDKNTSIWVEDENKKRICTVKNGENDNEIAALIAAAPELLEACKQSLKVLCYPSAVKDSKVREIYDIVHNAIAKAEGK
jgi:hypothetical protein